MFISKILLVGASASLLLLSAVASGAQDVRTEHVPIYVADLGAPTARQAVLARLEMATQRVCFRNYDAHNLNTSEDRRVCQRESMARALHDLGSAELIQAADQRSGGPAVQVARAPAQGVAAIR